MPPGHAVALGFACVSLARRRRWWIGGALNAGVSVRSTTKSNSSDSIGFTFTRSASLSARRTPRTTPTPSPSTALPSSNPLLRRLPPPPPPAFLLASCAASSTHTQSPASGHSSTHTPTDGCISVDVGSSCANGCHRCGRLVIDPSPHSAPLWSRRCHRCSGSPLPMPFQPTTMDAKNMTNQM